MHSKDIPVHLPFGPPPVLPAVVRQLEEFLICPENLPIHDCNRVQQHWGRIPQPYNLFRVDFAPLGVSLKVRRDFGTGEVIDFVEVPVGAGAKFNKTNEPSWGGYLSGPDDLLKKPVFDIADVNFDKDLETRPPGFPFGVEFKDDGFTPVGQNEYKPIQRKSSYRSSDDEPSPFSATVVNIMDLVEKEQELLNEWKAADKLSAEKSVSELDSVAESIQDDDVIPKEVTLPVLKIRDTVSLTHTKFQWAELVDVSQPMTDFERRVPNMAHKFEFELDTFQKQAVVMLEGRSDVFVAAHTSAGKTVVAEYAIALSMKHMTKAIYTSPIKALSNQKYRDFRQTFGDVGLITGDFKMNETASCLIMTTEILRSMLYCRSDVLPDLEYVIFDEVHYINDAERGHVWEEVLIMLPPSVSVVMLSATVPNTLEFAQWVGRTRQKKVYVITTPKRPVPLEHYLYTGTGGSSKNDRFLIMDGQEQFLLEGYRKAEKSREKKQPTRGHERAPSHRSYWSPKQEKTLWVALIDHLRQRSELPVVAFTLSRNRCDKNAEELQSLDLTNSIEKHTIDRFFQKCIQQLQDADKHLPQVMRLKNLLKRGIGVHHSGILPILKEIVEMLFQDGLVKLLFATETFAMGVNMPTRSVIFDSIRKYDGVEWRSLMPGEYIQMAGRAGRRGKDRVGNVLLLCKAEIPREVDLRNMMKGRPTALQSKFRLTYKMMLNLLRRQNLPVEEMMSRSFKENNIQELRERTISELKDVEREIKARVQIGNDAPHMKQLADFCKSALDFLSRWNHSRDNVVVACTKHLSPGRVVLLSHKEYYNTLGVILMKEVAKQELLYRVLVLCKAQESSEDEPPASENDDNSQTDELNKILTFATSDKFEMPLDLGGHTLLLIRGRDIIKISGVCVEVKNALIVKQDWEKRQMPRFRDAPVGPTCAQLVSSLTTLMQRVSLGECELEWLHPVHDLKVTELSLAIEIEELEELQSKLKCHPCTRFANLKEEMKEVYGYLKLEHKRDNLKYRVSYQSMTLYPDYVNRINVLRRLRYIDDHDTVELKGKVACEMSSHELMITELVMEGVLTDLPSAEIAALLSCLIFQHKTDVEQKLSKKLEQGIDEIKRIHQGIKNVEKECQVGTEDPSCEYENQLNFNLVQVVYEWAKEKPFAEIMELTDIQEGIIVRCIQQLHETLQDVKRAARIYGDPNLSNKMDEASNAIKRDIVFSVSLYTKKDLVKEFLPSS